MYQLVFPQNRLPDVKEILDIVNLQCPSNTYTELPPDDFPLEEGCSVILGIGSNKSISVISAWLNTLNEPGIKGDTVPFSNRPEA
jgi:hypothetical protein